MSNQIKVFVLIKGLGLGGAEKLLEASIPYFDRSQFDYEIGYLLPWKNALAPAFQEAGIPVFCLDQRQPYDLRILPKLRGLLRNRKVDVLHLHLPYSGILGRLTSQFAPVQAVVYTEHNVWERYHWLTAAMNRLTFRWNDAVIAVSEEVERSIRAGYAVNGRPHLGTILNGVDRERLALLAQGSQTVREEFGIPPTHRLVAHVASFTPKKRHSDLLRAARLVLDQNPAVTFLLVGQGPLQEAIKAEAERLGVTNNVIFAGFRRDVPRLVAAADLFVLSSLYEGLPISLLEAMALGTPVVATRVGGIPEVITDGVEGCLVDPQQPEQMAQRVLGLLGDAERRQRFAENGLRKVRDQFDIRKMVANTENLYREVLARKAGD